MGRWSQNDRSCTLTSCRSLAQDPSRTSLLEKYWDEHRIREDIPDDSSSRTASPSLDKAKKRRSGEYNDLVRSRTRAVSTGSALGPPGQSLSPHHPALSLPTFLDTFGPLIFPIYKAALLRERLLIVGSAPVELACNFGAYASHPASDKQRR